MNADLEKHLAWLEQLPADTLKFTTGLEKEGLRTLPDRTIAQTSHPEGLGSALTHSSITTDYSEALLEFITPPGTDAESNLRFMGDLHRFAYLNMPENERIWPGSMPAVIGTELDIPIARYGSSNIGRLKHVYRHGLWHRYGRIMQAIAGLHFNFSFQDNFWAAYQDYKGNSKLIQDFRSDRYFALIRHFRRHSWLLMSLFGASPAMDSSFTQGRIPAGLKQISRHSLYSEEATSLRMSDIGYTNNAQSGLYVCFNSLPTYIQTLKKAIHTDYPPYVEMGIKKEGEYRQINTHILQIENEYYSDIRPKQITRSGEQPSAALQRRGVQYIEIRCMDLNPFEPLGIDLDTVSFLEMFALWCLLSESGPLSARECSDFRERLTIAVNHGRNLEHVSRFGEKEGTLRQHGHAIISDLAGLAGILDHKHETDRYSRALAVARQRLDDPDQLPSSRLLNMMKEQQADYSEVTGMLADQHRETLLKKPLATDTASRLQEEASTSLYKQAELEKSDQQSFDEFLLDYQSKTMS